MNRSPDAIDKLFRNPLLLFIGFLALFGAAWLMALSERNKQQQTLTAPAPSVAPQVTLAKYNSLQAGMTHEQITSIMGWSGKLDWERKDGDRTLSKVVWKEGGNTVFVVFANGRAHSISRYGFD